MTRSALVRQLGSADVAHYRTIRLLTLETEPAFFGTTYAEEAERPPAHFAAILSESAVFGAFDGQQPVGVVRLVAKTGAKERHKGPSKASSSTRTGAAPAWERR